LQSCAHVEAAELWTMPYLTLLYQSSREGRQALAAEQARFAPAALPPEWAITNVGLQKGRLLHLKGMFAGDQGANRYYQLARPSDAAIAEGRFALPDQAANPQEEPPKAPLSDEQQQLVASYKQDASYWLGLVAYERGAYDVAVDYLQNRTIGAAPDGPWTEGAYYNLGRAYEALGRIPEAVAAYTAQVPQASPQRHGTLLRARRLRESFE